MLIDSNNAASMSIAFLVSPLCSNLTGEALLVDGGFSKSYF